LKLRLNGYFWRAGYTNIGHENIIEERKIICIFISGSIEKIHRLTWDKNLCDRQMLIDFIKVANQADEMIAHNG
jgi:regulator of extracellular matrix RemA (YlzA/DUF370 family)